MYLFPQIKKSMDCNYVKDNKGIESILLFIKSHKQPHLLYLSVSVLVSIHVTFTGFLIHLQKTQNTVEENDTKQNSLKQSFSCSWFNVYSKIKFVSTFKKRSTSIRSGEKEKHEQLSSIFQ